MDSNSRLNTSTKARKERRGVKYNYTEEEREQPLEWKTGAKISNYMQTLAVDGAWEKSNKGNQLQAAIA